MAKAKKYEHELTVEFGGMSAKDNAGIAFAFERNGHALDDIDGWLCGKRLEVFAVVGTGIDQRQKTLPGVESEPRPHVEATCDVKHFSVKPQKISARLVFSLNEVDVRELSGMAGKSGTLRLNVLGAMESEEEDDEAEEEEAPRRRQRRIPVAKPEAGSGPRKLDAGAAMPIETLIKFKLSDDDKGITKAKCEALRESELEIRTVGDLERAIAGDAWWSSKVKGFGEEWITRLTNSLVAFRNEFPVPPEAEYREIDGFTGYRVGDDGTVWSRWSDHGNKEGKPVLTDQWKLKVANAGEYGHLTVSLYQDGKRFPKLVHRLVLEAFVGPCPEGMEACHFPDPNPGNNRLDNLKWGTPKENAEHRAIHGHQHSMPGEQHPNAVLTEAQVAEIRSLKGTLSQREIGKRFGIHQVQVGRIQRGERWKNVVDESAAKSGELPAQSVQFPDRNGDGTDISTEGLQDFASDGDGWGVTVYVGKASDGLYRSCLMATVGEDSGGRVIPIEESRPYRTVEDAGRAAVDDLITAWAASDLEAKRTLCDPLRRFRDETWPQDAAAPADVPFGH